MATQQLDIALTHIDALNDDVSIVNGDFACVESTGEHQRQLLLNAKGSFKQNPVICVDLFSYLDDDNGLQNVVRAMNKEFTRDGMQVNGISIDAAGNINSDAYYP